MEDGRIPKDLIYGELAIGKRRTGRPVLRYKDACKRDLRSCNIDVEHWEESASNRASWRQMVKKGINAADKNRFDEWSEKRQRRKAAISSKHLLPLSVVLATRTATHILDC